MMAKFKFHFHAGCRCSLATKTIEVPDIELLGLNELQIERYVRENYYKPWLDDLTEEHIERVPN